MVTSEAICVCSEWDATKTDVRLCEPCHRYWRKNKRLVSVSQLIRDVWPVKPDYSAAPPAVLENARDRGIDVDRLLTMELRGQLGDSYPLGTREDSIELFEKLMECWDNMGLVEVASQVLLADNDVAGTCDILADGWIFDLKTTYKLEPYYELQVGMYGLLYDAMHGHPPAGLGIIHLTKRQPVKYVDLDVTQCMKDAQLLYDTYFMAQRRIGK